MEAEEAKNAERMRALRYKTHASSAALIIENVERPVPEAKELLLQIIAVGLNPLDIKLLKNPIHEIMGLKLPFIPGRDFTAIVIDNSRIEDSRFQIGSIVWGMTPNPMKDGSLCEYICLSESFVTLAPRRQGTRFDPVSLASMPLVGLTVVESLEPYLRWLKKRNETPEGKRILIQGGSGGVGSFAVQYARSFGMFVVATTSPTNFAFVQSLGADEVISYCDHANPWHKNPLAFNMDIVLDAFSYRHRKVTLESDDILTTHGFYVDIASSPHRLSGAFQDPLGLCVPEASAPSVLDATFTGVWETVLNWYHTINMRPRSRSYALFFVYPSAPHLRKVRDLVVSGAVKPVAWKTFNFTTSECRAAFDEVEKGHVRGKVVVEVTG